MGLGAEEGSLVGEEGWTGEGSGRGGLAVGWTGASAGRAGELVGFVGLVRPLAKTDLFGEAGRDEVLTGEAGRAKGEDLLEAVDAGFDDAPVLVTPGLRNDA